MEFLGWRGLLAAVLLSTPAWARDGEAVPDSEPQVAEAEAAEDGEPLVVAVADVPPSGAAVTEVPATGALPAEPKKAKKKKKPAASLGEEPDALDDAAEADPGAPAVRVFGRVFARASADERDAYERKLRVPDARVGVGATFRNIEAEVTADLSSKSILKDAFVRLADNSKRLRLYGGQFKAPFLSRENDSAWRLPLLKRGLVNDYLVEEHQLGGRRFGLMGEVRLKQAWDFKVSGGLFQGGQSELGERLSEDASARVSVRPFKALTLGTSTYLGEVLEGTRRHAVAADATLRLGPLGLTGEYVTGRLPLGPFDAQLGTATFTLPLDTAGEWALQPVVGAELLRLRGEVVGQGWSAVGGLNILFADTFKAQLQAERALRPGDAAPGLEYSLQLATRF